MSSKTLRWGCFLWVFCWGFGPSIFSHHENTPEAMEGQERKIGAETEGGPIPGISGQAPLRFRVLHDSEHLPVSARAVLESAHGGFAVDRRPGRGETYFALPGEGILRISGDLKDVERVETPAEMLDLNLHNTTIWYGPDGKPFLSFPADGAGQVFTTDLSGKLVNKLSKPDPETNFEVAYVREYFASGGKFAPTDVEQLDGLLYVTTGYSDLDYVLTARMTGVAAIDASWSNLAFGGKGEGPGQFGTGHGITVPPGARVLDVSDRPNAQIDRFSPDGHYLQTLELPAGSFPCDIDYESDLSAVACLHGPDRSRGAPLYILRGMQVVSTVHPKEDLGLKEFQHLHNAVLRRIEGRWYIIVQAWNPGGFAILEQVEDGSSETR